MRYMMLLKGNEETETGALPDEGIVAAMMKYNQDMMDAGVYVAGEGLYPSSKGARVRFHGGKPTVIDGPFAEAKELVAGYWLIQTKSKEEAIEWAKRAPLDAPPGQSVQLELRQVFEVEDFPVGENESGWREKELAERAALPASPPVKPGYKPFIVFRKASKDSEAGIMPGEELLTAMGAYNAEMINAGGFLGGEGLQPSSKGARIFYSGGKRTVVDGPFAETKDLIAGFSVIQVKSKEEAIDWVKRWPALDENGEVELDVRQIFSADEFAAELSPELRDVARRQREQVAGR